MLLSRNSSVRSPALAASCAIARSASGAVLVAVQPSCLTNAAACVHLRLRRAARGYAASCSVEMRECT